MPQKNEEEQYWEKYFMPIDDSASYEEAEDHIEHDEGFFEDDEEDEDEDFEEDRKRIREEEIDSNREKIIHTLYDDYFWNNYAVGMLRLLEMSDFDEYEVDEIVFNLQDAIQEGNIDAKEIASLYKYLIDERDQDDPNFEKRKEIAQRILEIVLKETGLKDQKMVEAWRESLHDRDEDDIIHTIYQNIISILNIYKKNPNIPRKLVEEFGIKAFARYPEDLLVEQYEQRNNTRIPYGTIISARSDHNGAFYRNSDVFSTLNKDLKSTSMGATLRVVEVGSKAELIRMLRKLNKRYGKHQKMQFSILSGHGSPYSVSLGSINFDKYEEEELETLSIEELARENRSRILIKDDMQHPIMETFKSMYVENPTFILIACSAGKENNEAPVSSFARDLSRSFDAKVVSSSEDGNLEELQVTETPNGDLSFQGKYIIKGERPSPTRQVIEATYYDSGEKKPPSSQNLAA